MIRAQPSHRADFALLQALETRWSDNDIYGHMNNAAHYLLFDTAINRWLIERGLLDPVSGAMIGLVVETGCRYHTEVRFPDRVTAGLAVERLGTTSVAYRIGLFRNDEDAAFADGRFVHVYVDRASRRPVPLPPIWRQTLEEITR